MDVLKTLAMTAGLIAAAPAAAHVSVQPKTAPAGAYQVLRFGIGHGCEGKATTRLTVHIPPAVPTARPQPKPGWRLDIGRAPGQPGRVTAVTWTGRLPADQFDEFVMLVRLPASGSALEFPADQACGPTVVPWAGADPAHPAPRLELAPGPAPDARHDHH